MMRPVCTNCVAIVVTAFPALLFTTSTRAEPGATPDVIVGDLPATQYWGESGVIKAYSIATTECAVSGVGVNWVQAGLDHPVIAQNIYRYRVLANGVGRFEQIGMSWVKHEFCPIQGNDCGLGCTPDCGAGCCDQLGPGCSTPSSASVNGSWSLLGPRSEVNATTGAFIWPHGLASDDSTVRGRIQVRSAALDAADRHFIEGQAIAPDDATAGNGGNNATWREVTLAGNTLLGAGGSVAMQPALLAWAAEQPGVDVQTLSFDSGNGEEIFLVAHAVTDLGDGIWNYEYAVHNLQSDRAGAGFTVPIAEHVTVTNVAVHMINHHSGEPYSTLPWSATVNSNDVTWAVQDVGADSNALRWGTMFNFRFDADAPPMATEATLGLFKAGAPTALIVPVQSPSCGPANDTLPGDTNGDDVVDIDDIVSVVLDFGFVGPGPPNGGDVNGDGIVNIDDIVFVVLNFGIVCRPAPVDH